MLEKQIKRQRRHKKIRATIFGTDKKPRLCVFRSQSHIYAQLINDNKGQTIVSASDKELKGKHNKEKKEGKEYKAKQEKAYLVGKLIAEKAQKGNIKNIVFDRGGYKYQGRVEALADGAREGGLKF